MTLIRCGGQRILIVDDNVDAAEVLAEMLGIAGHQVAVAHDGPMTLEMLGTFQPDVAILDIGLPVMDGYELARRIRELPSFKGVRLVALTGYGQESDHRRSLEAGFDAHLVKPIDFEELQGLLAADA